MSGGRYAPPWRDGEATPMSEMLQHVIDLMDCELGERCRVIRTSKTEERAPISHSLRVEVYKRDRFCCVWCGRSNRLELDHIEPWSAGGKDTFDNLRTLCHWCNEYRSNYETPLDSLSRRLPSGWQCVYCEPAILGDSELTAIYCRTCRQKACGLPGLANITPLERDDWEVA